MTSPAPTVLTPTIKQGTRTTEFWLSTVVPALLAVATLVFHRDFSAYVPAVAIAVSAISAAAYAVSRANLKKPVDLASLLFDVKALLPVAKAAEQAAVEVRKVVPPKNPTAGSNPTVTVKG